MKLKTLAIAIALGAMPFAAQADFKVSGDFSVGYFGDADGTKELREQGSEVNFDASEKVGGTTFYGHAEFDFNGSGSFSYQDPDEPTELKTVADTLTIQEVRVGAKGAWGDFAMGEADNGCDATDVGGYPDQWMANNQGGCKGSDVNNFVYKRSMGMATVAVSHNPNGDKYNAIGIKAKVGPVTASLGYEAGDALGSNDKNVAFGVSGTFGPVSVGLRGNKADDYDNTAVGVNASYSAGANTFYGGFGQDAAEVDRWAVGYNRAIGSNTTFIFEAAETDIDGLDTEYGVGLKHAF